MPAPPPTWTINPAGSLRFAGYVGLEPVKITRSSLLTTSRVLSVFVPFEGVQGSVSVSTSEQAARFGLGRPILPDEDFSLTAEALYLVGPKDRKDGQGAIAVVEQLVSAPVRTRSLRGALNAITAFKSSEDGKPITPRVWVQPWTNVLGMLGLVLRVIGPGRIYIGTQVDTSAPPPPTVEAMKTTGGCGWLRESDGLVPIPGNPTLSVYTLDDGMTLQGWKIGGGRQYGADGMVLPDS